MLVMGGQVEPPGRPDIWKASSTENTKSKIFLTTFAGMAAAGLYGPGDESDICSNWIGALGTTAQGRSYGRAW